MTTTIHENSHLHNNQHRWQQTDQLEEDNYKGKTNLGSYTSQIYRIRPNYIETTSRKTDNQQGQTASKELMTKYLNIAVFRNPHNIIYQALVINTSYLKQSMHWTHYIIYSNSRLIYCFHTWAESLQHGSVLVWRLTAK